MREVALGNDGLAEGFDGGELVIDTSSCEPWLTVETAKGLAASGIEMVDAPSGAEMGAKAAALVFMLGGTDAAVARARRARDLGKHQFHLGRSARATR